MKTLLFVLILSFVSGCKMSDFDMFRTNPEEEARAKEMERAIKMQQALEDASEKVNETSDSNEK